MKLVVGLGNPGPRYRGTLHNVGFEVVDEMAARHGAAFESSPAEALTARIRGMGSDGVLLAKPLTFMNLSGRAVGELVRFYKIPLDDLLVVVDEVALPAGQLRVRARGTAGGHNGLKSIIGQLGSDAFPRLRIGVGRGDPRRDLADHVLAKIDPVMRATFDESVQRAADAVTSFCTDGIERTMNVFNAPTEARDTNSLPPRNPA